MSNKLARIGGRLDFRFGRDELFSLFEDLGPVESKIHQDYQVYILGRLSEYKQILGDDGPPIADEIFVVRAFDFNERVVGFAAGYLDSYLPSLAELVVITVHPDFRRQRLGTNFHDYIVRELHSNLYINYINVILSEMHELDIVPFFTQLGYVNFSSGSPDTPDPSDYMLNIKRPGTRPGIDLYPPGTDFVIT